MKRVKQLLRLPLEHALAATFIVYLFILFGCLYFNRPNRQSDREYLAMQDLPLNHRITAVDVQRPATLATSVGFYMAPLATLEGRYLKQSIKRGERLSAAILDDRPSLRFSDSFRAIAFPLQTGSIPIDLIDVDSPIVLLGRDPDSKCPIAVSAVVHAIVCEQKPGNAPNCYPILRVPTDKSQMVVKNQSALHLALPPKPEP